MYRHCFRVRDHSVKVYHCVNGNRPFDGQNLFGTIVTCQIDRHYVHKCQCKFDREGDGYGEGEGDGTCKLALKQHLLPYYMSISSRKSYLLPPATVVAGR